MKSILLLLIPAFGLIGMTSCEKPPAPEVLPILDPGVSFPFQLRANGDVNCQIRLKFTPNSKPEKLGALKYIVEVSTSKDFNDFDNLVRALSEVEEYGAFSRYLNKFTFALKDKDGFSIEKIEISDPKDQPISLRDKSTLEYSGIAYLRNEEGLKITDCTLHSSFQPNLKHLLKDVE